QNLQMHLQNQQPMRPPPTADASHITNEDFQLWKQAFAKITRPFTYNGTTIALDMISAYTAHGQLNSRGDHQNAAVLYKVIQDIVTACQAEVGRTLTKEMVQLLLQDSAQQNASASASTSAAASAPDAPRSTNASYPQQPQPSASAATTATIAAGMQSVVAAASPAMAMGTVPGAIASGGNQAQQTTPAAAATAAAAAAAVPARKSVSGKSSPSVVANTKPKKKSQSPRTTTTKPRKATPPKPTVAAVSAAISSELPPQTHDAAVVALPALPRADSISTETATKIVAETIAAMDVDSIKRGPRIQLSDADKKAVRSNLPAIERLLEPLAKLLPVVYMRTREQDSIRKIFTIDVLAKEQRRLFAEDQFIISPAHINSLFEALRPFLTIAKEWGNTQQQHGLPPPPPPAAAVVAAADASSNRTQAP
ncbi:hypothetical protein IWW47_005075, partial [Coemansia sp. RSA 2052]